MPSSLPVPRTLRGRAIALTLAAMAVVPALPAAADGDTMADKLHRLRTCESSGNYRAHTGNGYYGAYQFDLQTWHGLGLQGRPDVYSKDTQDKATIKVHRARGWQPWPSCARREHLS